MAAAAARSRSSPASLASPAASRRSTTRARSARRATTSPAGSACRPALLLLGLGAVTLWRTRRTDGRLPARRAPRRCSASSGFLVAPARGRRRLRLRHDPRRPRRRPAEPPGRPVRGRDVRDRRRPRAAGWYIPSRNGAAVISFPGRSGPQKPARVLARHGYGVLLFDRRGEGESEGDPNSWGWGGEADIKAADRVPRSAGPDVDPERIGGIGLSVGGEMMIEAAAETTSSRAVVSEGAGARSTARTWTRTARSLRQGDRRRVGGARPPRSPCPPTSAAGRPEDLGGEGRGADAADRRARQGDRRGAQPRLPRGGARRARCGRSRSRPRRRLEARPEEYERRVVGFFDEALPMRHAGGLHDRHRRRPGARARRRVRAPGRRASASASTRSRAVALVAGRVRGSPRSRAFGRPARGARVVFGGLALVNGTLHVAARRIARRPGGDADRRARPRRGLVLLGLAAAIPWRSGEGAWRRAVRRTGALLARLFVLGPVGLGIVATHKWREPVGDRPAPRTATSRSTRATGWTCAAGTGRRATVPRCSSCTAAAATARARSAHAELLARHGYGVLLYDARGAARATAARTTTAGTGRRTSRARSRPARPGRRERIGALGLSTGADVLLEVRRRRDDVARSSPTAPPRLFEDWHGCAATSRRRARLVMFSTMRSFRRSARAAARGCRERIDEPTLLISAGAARSASQRALRRPRRGPGRALEPAGGGPHALASARAGGYERRVDGFLARRC